MPDLLILGPQARTPNLAPCLGSAGLHGPIAAITAGWQEREAELAPLEEHLGTPVQDLRLYARAEDVFAADREYHDAYRGRQAALRDVASRYAWREITPEQLRDAFERASGQDLSALWGHWFDEAAMTREEIEEIAGAAFAA